MGKRLFAFVLTSALFVGLLAAPSTADHGPMIELAGLEASEFALEVVVEIHDAPDSYYLGVQDLDGQRIDFMVRGDQVSVVAVGPNGTHRWSADESDHSGSVQENGMLLVLQLAHGPAPLLPGDVGIQLDLIPADGSPGTSILPHATVGPAGDSDSDGLDNYVDLEPFVSSSAFTNERRGATTVTFGVVQPGGWATVGDRGVAGVSVTVDSIETSSAVIEFACDPQRTLTFAPGTTAVVECGSISVSVETGTVTWTAGDGSTVVVNSGGNATETVNSSGDTELDTSGDVVVEKPPTGSVCDAPASDADLALLPNRFGVDAAGAFVDVRGKDSGYTLDDTGGCSATQIIELMELGKGHAKFGITMSVLEEWVSSIAG